MTLSEDHSMFTIMFIVWAITFFAFAPLIFSDIDLGE